MVDIGATTQARSLLRRGAGRDGAAGGLAEARIADAAALDDYEAFCRDAVFSPPQHPIWVRSWIAATGADALIVTIRREGRPAVALVIEVVCEGPFKVARFLGERHANGNFVACARGAERSISGAEKDALLRALRQARPDIDLVLLERQNPDHGGVKNPFSSLATMRSANVSLATDLTGGMDAMLERMNGKRKRKKYRLQLRRFEAAGGYRWFEARTPEEVERLISHFYAMKGVRLRKQGIPDVFATAEVQTFFRRLFHDALAARPAPFVLHGVEVGGEIRGVNGFSVTGHSLVCDFCAIRDDDHSISPGFYLDYVAMEKACEQGKAVYDLSVGDEDYKRSWCDIETWQFDTLLPLNARGRLAGAWRVERARAIRLVKSNRTAWTLLKKLRARLAGEKSAES